MASPSSFLAELKRRRVFRVLFAYSAAALVVIEAANNIFPAIDLPAWASRSVVVMALCGLPVALVLAWAFDITPDGVRRTPEEPLAAGTGRRPARAARVRAWARYGTAGIVVMAAAVAAYGWLGREGGRTPEGAAAGEDRSIAVLPFRNMSGDPANEYFSEGITEEILNALAGVPELRVASRTSSFAFKGKSEDVTGIGMRLRVTHVLEGSVQRAGGRVRITTQLVDARSGFQQWSSTYTRELEDVFALEDEISRDVARQLRIRLAPGVVLARRGTANPRAHDLYLQARRLVLGGAEPASLSVYKADLLESITIFQQALEADSAYAPAWSGIATAYLFLGEFYWAPREAYPPARQAALRALALDPQLAEAHGALGVVHLVFDWDFAAADRTLRRAIALNPDDPVARKALAMNHLRQHRLRQAVAEAVTTAQRDPGNQMWETEALIMRTAAGEGGFLLDSLRGVVRARLQDGNAADQLFWVSVFAGEWKYAAAELAKTSRDTAGAGPPDPLDPLILARGGDTLAARRSLQTVIAHRREQWMSPALIAAGYAALGEREVALGWMERALGERDGYLLFLDVWDWWSPLRGDPRFEHVRRQTARPLRG